MNELVDKLSDTLLWESICCYVEENVQVKELLKDIGYVDDKRLEGIKKSEIFESDEFVIEDINWCDNRYRIAFGMSVIIMFYNLEEQVLRVTTDVKGTCYIVDKNHYHWDQHDFERMDRLELLSYRSLVENIQCQYLDIECDDLSVI